MATNAQAQEHGFRTPQPSDFIRDGDDDISQNARAAVDLYRLGLRQGIVAAGAAAAEVYDGMQKVQVDEDSGRLYYADPPRTILRDTFDRADEAPVAPTPVGARPLIQGAGSIATQLAVKTGQLAFTFGPSSYGAAFWPTGRADGTFGITIADPARNATGLHGAGIVFRADTTLTNTYLVDGNGTGTGGTAYYRIRRRLAGTWSDLANLGRSPAAGDRLEVTTEGDRIIVAVNGTVLHNTTHPGGPTGTHIGVYLYGQLYAARFDDLRFTVPR